MKTKINQSKMVVDAFAVLRECIEAGASYGVNHAFKHTETPSRDCIVDNVEQAVLNAICERFSFPRIEQ